VGVVKRRTNVTLPGNEAGPSGVDEWLMAMPALAEFLTSSKYDDGSPRQCPTITVFYDHPLVKVCLNDRDQGLAAFVTAATVEGLWAALEEGLAKDSLDWRASQRPSGGGKKKRS